MSDGKKSGPLSHSGSTGQVEESGTPSLPGHSSQVEKFSPPLFGSTNKREESGLLSHSGPSWQAKGSDSPTVSRPTCCVKRSCQV